MSSNTLIKAGRALSTVATHMAPKVVLSNFCSDILPSFAAKAGTRSEPPTKLDPRDYGYRVVPPVAQPPLYTSTVVPNHDYAPDTVTCQGGTSSTLGRILHADADSNLNEVVAAQREWDAVLDMEPTRPHFEFYKEDPYNEYETAAALPDSLFASCVLHEEPASEELAWDEVA